MSGQLDVIGKVWTLHGPCQLTLLQGATNNGINPTIPNEKK